MTDWRDALPCVICDAHDCADRADCLARLTTASHRDHTRTGTRTGTRETRRP